MRKEIPIIVIGASAGGSVVLQELIQQFTGNVNAAIFVVIHLSKKAIGEMVVNRIQKFSSLTCTIPRHRERIQPNHIYFAPADRHMLIKEDQILLGNGPLENRYRPSIDALFRSAAASHGNKTIGVVLSGMLEDGTAGMLAIKSVQGKCIVQDPEEAEYSGMPSSIVDTLQPDFILPIAEMGSVIESLVRKVGKSKTKNVPVRLMKEAAIAENVYIGIDQVSRLGSHSLFSCPDCGGGLWEMKEGNFTNYRCHVGHAFSETGLLSAMEASTEAALWTALRILEERKNLLNKLGEKEVKNGKRQLTISFKKRARELEVHISALRDLLFKTQFDITP